MKNKKMIIIIIISAILLIAIALGTYIVLKRENTNYSQPNESESSQSSSADNNVVIKSSAVKRIEKDGIEAKELKIRAFGDQVEVKTTIKNNTKKSINGLLIEIELLDLNNNVITTITDNSSEKIEPGQTREILNYIMEEIDIKKIKTARIKTIEKDSIGNKLEQTFDEMTPDLDSQFGTKVEQSSEEQQTETQENTEENSEEDQVEAQESTEQDTEE